MAIVLDTEWQDRTLSMPIGTLQWSKVLSFLAQCHATIGHKHYRQQATCSKLGLYSDIVV